MCWIESLNTQGLFVTKVIVCHGYLVGSDAFYLLLYQNDKEKIYFQCPFSMNRLLHASLIFLMSI